jgi:hypothetical protein
VSSLEKAPLEQIQGDNALRMIRRLWAVTTHQIGVHIHSIAMVMLSNQATASKPSIHIASQHGEPRLKNHFDFEVL